MSFGSLGTGTCTDLWNVAHDKELAIQLGNVMVVWAYAETSMVMALSRLTGVGANRATQAYYRIPTFESRVKFIRALLIDWEDPNFDQPAKDVIDQAIIKLSGLSRTRNHWVHGLWSRHDATGQTVIFDFRSDRSSPKRMKPIKAADVGTHVMAVWRRAEDLYAAVRHRTLPP